MTEKREYLKSRFIDSETAKILLKRYRYKSAEEVKEAIEHAERQSDTQKKKKV